MEPKHNQNVQEMKLCGLRCIVDKRPRYVIVSVCGYRHDVSARSLDEARLLLSNWLRRKPRKKTQRLRREEEIRELLRLMRLPGAPVKVSPSHVRHARTGRYIVRRSMGGDGRSKLYFGTYLLREDAEQASKQLCRIINEEIRKRNELLSVNL